MKGDQFYNAAYAAMEQASGEERARSLLSAKEKRYGVEDLPSEDEL